MAIVQEVNKKNKVRGKTVTFLLSVKVEERTALATVTMPEVPADLNVFRRPHTHMKKLVRDIEEEVRCLAGMK